MNSDVITRTLLMVLVPFLFVVLIIPYIKKIAKAINAIDMPRTRHIHKVPTPKLGGLAIFLGFLLGYMIFGTHSVTMNAILIGSFIIIITGVIDDVSELSPVHKLIGQLAAALVITVYGKLLIIDVSAFGFYINFSFLSYPLTIFFIIGCINCINLIDGLDGLAGGIASIYFLTIGIIAVTLKSSSGLDTILTFVMLGSTLGYLYHNFYPAKIFMGDSGSMFLGYMISIIALLGYKNITFTSFIVPVFLLAIPILDTLFAIVRRLVNHKPISMPDKNHLHHQFLKKNFSQRKTVLVIYAIDILFAIASIVYVLGDFEQGIIIYIILFILVLVFVLKTDIIREHKKK